MDYETPFFWGNIPRRPIARLAQRLLFPLANVGTILAVIAAYWRGIFSSSFLAIFSSIGLITSWAVLLGLIGHWQFFDPEFSIFRNSSGKILGVARPSFMAKGMLILAFLTLFGTRFQIQNYGLMPNILWPIFILPIILIEIQWKSNNTTERMLVLIHFTTLTFYLSAWYISGDPMGLSILPSVWLYLSLLLTHFVYRLALLRESSHRAIVNIVTDLISMDDPYGNDAMQKIAEMISTNLGYERVFLLLVRGKGNDRTLEVIGAAGNDVDKEMARQTKFSVNTGICGRCVTEQKFQIENDISKVTHYYQGNSSNTRAELAFPLTDGKDIVAVIDIQSTWKFSKIWQAVSSEDIGVLEAIAKGLRSSARLDILRDYKVLNTAIIRWWIQVVNATVLCPKNTS